MQNEDIVYRHPTGIRTTRVGDQAYLTTIAQGLVAVDAPMLALWQRAEGRGLSEILATTPTEAVDATLAALVCLAEGGLLWRDRVGADPQPPSASREEVDARIVAVVVGYNSQMWLPGCFDSLGRQVGAAAEIVFVDNASQDDSAGWVMAHYPTVRVIALPSAVSLAAAINQGCAVVPDADYYLILNPDVELDGQAVAEMVRVAEATPQRGIVAPKLKFLWAPAFLNGIGNYVQDHSWGSDIGIGVLDLGQFDDWETVPSACFAAVLIHRAVWQAVGPVDDGFPLYYEDSEWSYRARRMGYHIRLATRAVVRHAFGGRQPTGQPDTLSPRKLAYVTYGRLRFALLLTGEDTPRWLWNYVREDALAILGALRRGHWAAAAARWRAWGWIARDWRMIVSARRAVDMRAAAGVEDVFRLPADLPMARVINGVPDLSWGVIERDYLPVLRARRTRSVPEMERHALQPRLLIVSHDVVDLTMAGTGMRYVEMARALAADLLVTLAVPNETAYTGEGFRVVRYWPERPQTLQVLVENHDIAVITDYMVRKFPFLETTKTRLVVDLIVPFVLENLHYFADEPVEQQLSRHDDAVAVTGLLARTGDFFMCGSERQRDFWLGVLAANGRVNPQTFADDHSLRKLIDVVGFGVPDRAAQRQQPVLGRVHPALAGDVKIVWWGGGIWNWLDPLTLIRAWPQALDEVPNARLVFGNKHPNPLVPQHAMAVQAQALAAEIGERDKTIFFIDWLPYAEREGALVESHVGAVLHTPHLETHFSVRTRVMDFVWGRLPVLIADGDVMSAWVQANGLGKVVPPQDVEATAAALIALLRQPKADWDAAFDAVTHSVQWRNVVEPLRRYCLTGQRAPDRVITALTMKPARPPLPVRAWQVLRRYGLAVTLRRARNLILYRLFQITVPE